MDVTNTASKAQATQFIPNNSSDDAVIFQKMIEGIMTTGMSLVNGFIGDTIEEIAKDENAS